MIRSVLFLLAPLLLFAGHYKIAPQQVANGVWCAIGDTTGPDPVNLGFISNVCWVDLGKSVALLDGGATALFAKELEAVVKATTNKPISHLVITNYHSYRSIGASYFEKNGNIKILAHKNILSDFANNQTKFDGWKSIFPPDIYKDSAIVKRIDTFEDKFIIKGDKITIELLKLSKNSSAPSDIVVYIPEHKLLFSGAILCNDRLLGYFDDSDMQGWIEAIEAIKRLDPMIIVPAHGAVGDKGSYELTKRYLNRLQDEIGRLYDDGVDLNSVVEMADMSEFEELNIFDALNGRNIYNYYLYLEKQP